MKIEHAHAGVGVVAKIGGTTHVIREVVNGLIYLEDNSFPINERAYRLANKPTRKELRERVAELEADKQTYYETVRDQEIELYAARKMIAELENQLDQKTKLVQEALWLVNMLDLPGYGSDQPIVLARLAFLRRAGKEAFDIANAILTGAYFDGRPQIERMQMIANLFDMIVTGSRLGLVQLWPKISSPEPQENLGGWHSEIDISTFVLPTAWTDLEPWTARVVGPQKDTPK